MSKQLLRDLETYKIKISTSKINSDVIHEFGYMAILDILSKGTSKVLRDICAPYFSWIGGMEDDDLMYAWRIAKVVIPGSEAEIELAKFAGGLEPKQIDLTEDAGKDIADCDKQDILECLERLLGIYGERKLAQQYLDRLLLGMMTIEDQIGVTGTTVGSEDDKQLTVVGVRGKDEIPTVVKTISSLSVEAVGQNDGTWSVDK